MSKTKLTKVGFLLAGLLMTASVFGNDLTPAERRMRSINAAKQIAERNIAETVLGVQLEYLASISNLDASSFSSSSVAIAKGKVRGIRLATQYDAKKDIAIATAELEVSKMFDIAPGWKNAGSTVIRRVGFSSTTPSSLRKIQAIRAAELDGYRALFQQVIGLKLESNTTVKDMMLKDDQIRSRCMGVLFAAKMITAPDDKDTIEWTDSSDKAGCTVTLELTVKDIEAVLEHKLLGTKADIIRVKGLGLQYRKPVKKPVKAARAAQPAKPKVITKTVIVEKKVPVVIESESKTQPVSSRVTP